MVSMILVRITAYFQKADVRYQLRRTVLVWRYGLEKMVYNNNLNRDSFHISIILFGCEKRKSSK